MSEILSRAIVNAGRDLRLSATTPERGKDRPSDLSLELPCRQTVIEAHKLLVALLLHGSLEPEAIIEEAVDLLGPEVIRGLCFQATQLDCEQTGARCLKMTDCRDLNSISEQVLAGLVASLPVLRQMVISDIKASFDGDPAARTYAEVRLSYPGLFAIVSHRIAHEFYRYGVPIIPRVMSEWVHTRTGVDIHPGAEIAEGLFIDHGTGVVIGETTVIGRNVRIYQGVTLGAKSFELDSQGNPVKGVKRHPTVEDDVIIYANAAILGGTTVIGRGSTVGGNVFITESVPPGSMVLSIHPELKLKAQR